MGLASDQQGPGHPESQKNINIFQCLMVSRIDYGTAAASSFSARRQDLPFAACQNRRARLPDGNTAYIKEQLCSRFRWSEPAFQENAPKPSMIARRFPDREASGARDRIDDRNHAQQSGSRRPSAGHQGRRRHVRRRRFVGDGRAVEVRRATTSSASRCSFTIMARPPIARAPAAPGRTSTMRATSPSGSASRITCWTTRAAFANR